MSLLSRRRSESPPAGAALATPPDSGAGAGAREWPHAATREAGGQIWPPASRVSQGGQTGGSRAAMARLVGAMRYELVPMASAERAIAGLPAGAPVSVTCSPVKGLPATMELAERLVAVGHDTVPHIAARMVESVAHARRLAAWIRATGLTEVFVIGGDAATPHGPYADALGLLRDLLTHDTGLRTIGVAAYPDGHALIADGVLQDALMTKQALLAEAGMAGSVTTQMCFDPERIRTWIDAERRAGVRTAVQLGVPGVVDRTKLMTMGVRLGVGASLRYLKKNRGSMMRMLAPGGFDPTDLVAALAPDAASLGITGLHSFTFNSTAETARWQHAIVEGVRA